MSIGERFVANYSDLPAELDGGSTTDVAEVGLGQVEQSADATFEEGGAGAGLGKALHHVPGDSRWEGESLGVGDDVDDHRAVVSKCFLEHRLEVFWLLDAEGLDADTLGDLGEVDLFVVGAEVGHAGDHHLEFDHAEGGVVEADHLHRQLVQFDGEQFAHKHAQAAVAGPGDDLAVRLCSLDADGHG